MPRSREGWLSTIRAISEMTEAHGCTKAEAVTARVKPVFYSYRHSLLGRSSPGAASRAIFSRRVQNVVPIILNIYSFLLLKY